MNRGVGTYRAQQPDVLRRFIHHAAGGGIGGRDRRGDALLQDHWQRVRFERFKAAAGCGREERDPLSERIGQVILNGGDQVRYGETRRQTSRELVKLLDFPLSMAQRFRLLPQARGKIAADQRHHQEQHEVDDFVRILDLETVERRKKQEISHRQAGNRRQGGRPDAPLGRRDNDRYQVRDRDEIGRKRLAEGEQDGRNHPDAHKRQQQRQDFLLPDAM